MIAVQMGDEDFIVSISAVLRPNRFMEIKADAPQSKRNLAPAASIKMQVCNRPPLPKASPLPRNLTDTDFILIYG
jgi:hypothetical protein